MKVNRQKFLLHLERILCKGQCTEVIFGGAFAVNALTLDQMLMVSAPSLPTVEPLSEEIGIADVEKMIKQVKLNAGEGNVGVEVDVYVDSDAKRLIIDDKERGLQRLLIAAPRTIVTRIEKETVEELLADAPSGKSVQLTRSLVEGVKNSFGLLKAEEVQLRVGPKGSKIVVGQENTDEAQYEVDYKSKEEYTLLFGRHLVDVFSIISDYSSAAVRLGGPNQPILVEDGGYRYLLSPRIRSADEKPAVKEDGGEAGEESEAPAAPKKKGGKKKASE